MAKVLKSERFAKIPAVDEDIYRDELSTALKNFSRKIVVLDDDPTGVELKKLSRLTSLNLTFRI